MSQEPSTPSFAALRRLQTFDRKAEARKREAMT